MSLWCWAIKIWFFFFISCISLHNRRFEFSSDLNWCDRECHGSIITWSYWSFFKFNTCIRFNILRFILTPWSCIYSRFTFVIIIFFLFVKFLLLFFQHFLFICFNFDQILNLSSNCFDLFRLIIFNIITDSKCFMTSTLASIWTIVFLIMLLLLLLHFNFIKNAQIYFVYNLTTIFLCRFWINLIFHSEFDFIIDRVFRFHLWTIWLFRLINYFWIFFFVKTFEALFSYMSQ